MFKGKKWTQFNLHYNYSWIRCSLFYELMPTWEALYQIDWFKGLKGLAAIIPFGFKFTANNCAHVALPIDMFFSLSHTLTVFFQLVQSVSFMGECVSWAKCLLLKGINIHNDQKLTPLQMVWDRQRQRIFFGLLFIIRTALTCHENGSWKWPQFNIGKVEYHVMWFCVCVTFGSNNTPKCDRF